MSDYSIDAYRRAQVDGAERRIQEAQARVDNAWVELINAERRYNLTRRESSSGIKMLHEVLTSAGHEVPPVPDWVNEPTLPYEPPLSATTAGSLSSEELLQLGLDCIQRYRPAAEEG